jgi:hypothetical protein
MTRPVRFLRRSVEPGISRGTARRWERPIYARNCPLQSGHPSRQHLDPTIQPQDPASASQGFVVSKERKKKRKIQRQLKLN